MNSKAKYSNIEWKIESENDGSNWSIQLHFTGDKYENAIEQNKIQKEVLALLSQGLGEDISIKTERVGRSMGGFAHFAIKIDKDNIDKINEKYPNFINTNIAHEKEIALTKDVLAKIYQYINLKEGEEYLKFGISSAAKPYTLNSEARFAKAMEYLNKENGDNIAYKNKNDLVEYNNNNDGYKVRLPNENIPPIIIAAQAAVKLDKKFEKPDIFNKNKSYKEIEFSIKQTENNQYCLQSQDERFFSNTYDEVKKLSKSQLDKIKSAYDGYNLSAEQIIEPPTEKNGNRFPQEHVIIPSEVLGEIVNDGNFAKFKEEQARKAKEENEKQEAARKIAEEERKVAEMQRKKHLDDTAPSAKNSLLVLNSKAKYNNTEWKIERENDGSNWSIQLHFTDDKYKDGMEQNKIQNEILTLLSQKLGDDISIKTERVGRSMGGFAHFAIKIDKDNIDKINEKYPNFINNHVMEIEEVEEGPIKDIIEQTIIHCSKSDQEKSVKLINEFKEIPKSISHPKDQVDEAIYKIENNLKTDNSHFAKSLEKLLDFCDSIKASFKNRLP